MTKNAITVKNTVILLETAQNPEMILGEAVTAPLEGLDPEIRDLEIEAAVTRDVEGQAVALDQGLLAPGQGQEVMIGKLVEVRKVVEEIQAARVLQVDPRKEVREVSPEVREVSPEAREVRPKAAEGRGLIKCGYFSFSRLVILMVGERFFRAQIFFLN